MGASRRLQTLLDWHRVRYEVVPHRVEFTAQDLAQSVHVPGRRLAKPVVLRDSTGSVFMIVMPATAHLNRWFVEDVTGRRGVEVEREDVLEHLFPDCEIGAMPPIGHLYDLPMYVDPCLIEGQSEIWFQAGNHHELIRMRTEDFERIARPFESHACLHNQPAETFA